tara:strand:+ start:205 stop:378 length:174 start_codon:yes stop_codon:yes gene_type:complete
MDFNAKTRGLLNEAAEALHEVHLDEFYYDHELSMKAFELTKEVKKLIAQVNTRRYDS